MFREWKYVKCMPMCEMHENHNSIAINHGNHPPRSGLALGPSAGTSSYAPPLCFALSFCGLGLLHFGCRSFCVCMQAGSPRLSGGGWPPPSGLNAPHRGRRCPPPPRGTGPTSCGVCRCPPRTPSRAARCTRSTRCSSRCRAGPPLPPPGLSWS